MNTTILTHIKTHSKGIGAIALLAIFITIFANFTDCHTEPSSTTPLSAVVIPSVPDSILFANEQIGLDRWDMYERFDRELTTFCYMHSSTLLMFKRANKIYPQIAPILEAEGIPDDFKYLASIESFLDPRALSPAKAAGLWQILASTAKEYGLEVNNYVDERYHTAKATKAACSYLKEAHKKYSSWTTAAASYNAGMGRISRFLESQEQESAFDILLVDETSRYVFRMMALKQVMEHPQQYGFVITEEQLYRPIPTYQVKVTTPIDDLTAFAKEQGISYRELKEFNPWLRENKLPNASGKEYIIEIPKRETMYYSNCPTETYDKRWITTKQTATEQL